MNILLCGNSVGGHLFGLKLGLEKLGHNAKVVYSTRNPYGFDCDESLYGLSRFEILQYVRNNYTSYDVIHYSNGESLLTDGSDLRIIKEKPVFFTFNGSSTRSILKCMRQDYSEFGIYGRIWDRNILELSRTGYLRYLLFLVFLEYKSRQRIKSCVKTGSHIFALNPDLYQPGKSTFIPYAKSSYYSNTNVKNRYETTGTLHVVHAPTSRLIKGSKYIINAVNKLKSQGCNIELTLIENMTNVDAIKMIFTADLLIDQLLVGWYGGVAVEAMQMGIPVACYIRNKDLNALPKQMREDMPVINCSIENIDQVLLSCYEDRNMLVEKAKLSRQYALTYHDPVYSAKRVSEEYFKHT